MPLSPNNFFADQNNIVAAAVLAWFMLPNSPLQTRWLTPDERQLAHNRIVEDTTGKQGKVSTWKGLGAACSDYRMWIFALMQNLHLSAKYVSIIFVAAKSSTDHTRRLPVASRTFYQQLSRRWDFPQPLRSCLHARHTS